MDRERLKKQLDFILEIDKEKNILRQTHVTGHKRQENDAEHAWHMAIMVYLLKEYSNRDFDVAKAMMMTLIHDVVEIDAGDTYAYCEEGTKDQKEREAKAAERIFGILPLEQCETLRALFEEFEEGESAESQFVRAMDNLQPFLLNDANNGADWISHAVRKSQVMERQIRTKKGSEKLWEITRELIEKNAQKGNLIDE